MFKKSFLITSEEEGNKCDGKIFSELWTKPGYVVREFTLQHKRTVLCKQAKFACCDFYYYFLYFFFLW